VPGTVIAMQLMKSGTSVGANYRAARRGRSRKEFLAKLGIVEEEADESVYWLRLITGGKLMPERRVGPLLQEAREILAIIVQARKSAKQMGG
jgi:four helix bundle protein